MLDGVWRKVSFVLVFLSACGWVVFVTGFGIRSSEYNGSVATSLFTSHWLFAITALLAYLLYFLHLLCGNRVSAAIVMCLLPVCVAAAGAVLQFDSRSSGCENSFPSLFTGNFELYLIMEWVGTSFAAVCLWLSLVLWPLLNYSNREDDYIAINN